MSCPDCQREKGLCLPHAMWGTDEDVTALRGAERWDKPEPDMTPPERYSGE